MRAVFVPVLVAVALVLPSGAGAAGPADCVVPTLDDRCEAWLDTYDIPNRYGGPSWGHDEAFAVAVSPLGERLYVAGSAYTDDGAEDIVALAYDAATGQRLWVARHAVAGRDLPAEVAVSPDGGTVFVIGAAGGDYVTLAYDAADGELRWRRTYDGPAGGPDEARALQVTADGSTVVVTGHSLGPGGITGIATIAYDAADGTERWIVRRDGEKDQRAFAMALSPSGTELYLGGDHDGDQGGETFSVAYELPTEEGEAPSERWAASYDPSSAFYENGGGYYFYGGYNPVAVSPDGGLVYVSGANAILAFDAATGERRWLRLLDTADVPQVIMGLAPSADGSRIYATGESSGIAGTYVEFATVALDPATGGVIWSARSNTYGHAHTLTLDREERTLYVTGTSCNTIAYDAVSGTQLWSALYPGTTFPVRSDCWDAAALPGGGAAVVGRVIGDEVEDVVAEARTSDLLVLRY